MPSPHLKATHSPSASVDTGQCTRVPGCPSLPPLRFRQDPRGPVLGPRAWAPLCVPVPFPGTSWLQKLSCLLRTMSLVPLDRVIAMGDWSPALQLKQAFAVSGCSRFQRKRRLGLCMVVPTLPDAARQLGAGEAACLVVSIRAEGLTPPPGAAPAQAPLGSTKDGFVHLVWVDSRHLLGQARGQALGTWPWTHRRGPCLLCRGSQ